MYKYHIFLIHSSVVGHLGCFHSLAMVNSTEINNLSHIPLLYPMKWYYWIIWKVYVQFFKPLYCFTKWLCWLTFLPAMNEGSFSHASSQTFVMLVFLIVAILTGLRWNHSVVFMCIFIMGRMDNIFSVFWPFGLLPLKRFCLG
jgi:hypothetical protein